MKPIKIFLLVLCFGLVTANIFKVQAEEWKSVFGAGAGKAESRQPEKKLYKSDGFVKQTTSGRAVATGDENKPRTPLNVVFVRGYDATTQIFNRSFQQAMRKSFKGQNVKFVCLKNQKEMTRSRTLESFQGADILFLNAHGSQDGFSGMQWIKVAKSADNHNISPGGNAVLTSLDIKKSFDGKKKPKLVIFNICYGIDPVGVPPKNLFSAAFGIDEESQGRAFISWKGSKYGIPLDSGIRIYILNKWTVKDPDTGKYPRLKDVYSNTKSESGGPFIVGDLNTRLITDEYFVLFQLTIPTPRKEFEKIEKRAGESSAKWKARKKEWQKRKTAYYQGLTYDDFEFVEKPLEKIAFIIKVVEEGMEYYPEDYFTATTEFAVKVNGTTKTGEGERVPLKGALLLKQRGIYQSFEELLEENPSLERKKLKALVFNQDDGKPRHIGKAGTKNHFSFDVIEKGWTKQDKIEAVNLAKLWLMFFDCFVAHAVYDDSQAKPITVFRNFRDRVLKKSWEGRHLVRLYYEYGPEYAVRLRNNPEYIPYVRWCLDRFSGLLEGFDLDDVETCSEMQPFIAVADKIASVFFKEGESNGFGQLAGTIEPQIWY